jgi:TonB family protein
MAAVADRRSPPGLPPWEVGLTFGLSILLHGLLLIVVILMPRLHVGTSVRVPVSYTVSLVDAPPGGRSAGVTPPVPRATPAPPPAQPAPTVRAPLPAQAPVPRPAPAEELTLPGRRPASKSRPAPEPSLRLPSVTGRETARLATPAPPAAVPLVPAVPAEPAQRVASSSTGTAAGAGKTSGVEVAGTGSGAEASGPLASYLTLLDWKIQQNWVPMGAAAAPEAVVTVRFRVLRSGQVRDLAVETSSGNASQDASALRAIRQSVPLPPFPNLLTEPSLDLRYRFVMERG